MVTQLTPGDDDGAATMACIGFVCIQWALLEANLLAVLAACQGVTIEEAAILFGSFIPDEVLGKSEYYVSV